MNYVARTIGWADFTIGPVKGRCRGGCWYCYDHGRHQRFHLDPTPRLDLSVFEKPRKRKKPARIFVCSTHDLFGDWIPVDWIEAVLRQAADSPQHVFQFLTKNLSRAASFWFLFPRNAWVGATVDQQKAVEQVTVLTGLKDNTRFISCEPLLERIELPEELLEALNLLIIGPLTVRGGRTRQPEPEWVESLLRQADQYKVPVFMKPNLKWRDKRQEFPNEGR